MFPNDSSDFGSIPYIHIYIYHGILGGILMYTLSSPFSERSLLNLVEPCFLVILAATLWARRQAGPGGLQSAQPWHRRDGSAAKALIEISENLRPGVDDES